MRVRVAKRLRFARFFDNDKNFIASIKAIEKLQYLVLKIDFLGQKIEQKNLFKKS